MNHLERLAARVEATRTSLCVGIDPDPGALPADHPSGVEGVEQFANLLLDAAIAHAAAIKVNLAFFEAFGSAGIAALERLRSRVPRELPFVADVKRGDIGSTAARQAVALFDALDADAVTASPYLGFDAIAPFVERSDRFVYVLCRTSNPGAAELQGLDVAGEPLFVHVARRAVAWAALANDNIGLVVGATAPDELRRVRDTAPSLALLVPGVGVQGGDIETVMEHGPARRGIAAAGRGGGLLVNVSRSIPQAALDAADPAAALDEAAAHWARLLRC